LREQIRDPEFFHFESIPTALTDLELAHGESKLTARDLELAHVVIYISTRKLETWSSLIFE
jgi:hypothetical protein